MPKTIIISTGGTGGHIFPAQCSAEKLTDLGFRVIIFGDKNYSKYHKAKNTYEKNAYKFKTINSSQIKRGLTLFTAAVKITVGILQSAFWIIMYRPKIIVAFGGYATFPTLISAIILRRKIILHEQNAHLGKVNRIFGKFANKIALSYKKTDGIKNLPKNKFIFTGNLVRRDILKLNEITYELPNFNQPKSQPKNLGYDVLLASEFNNNDSLKNLFNILVIGGSGGAKIFSEILPRAFFNLRDEIKSQISITQQCRAEFLDKTFEQYQSFNLNIAINSFFDDMPEKISEAHLIIARAGSSSLAEFTCAKKPMILIPFASSADNHQGKNARYVEKMGGAIVIKEEDFTINKMTKTLEKLIDNPAMLKKMSKNSSACANLSATDNLSNLIANF